MTDRTFRALTWSLLASTAFIQPALAQDTAAAPGPVAQPTPSEATDQSAPAAAQEDDNVIIVTATKREENLQNVPVSIQAIGTKRLDQLNISNFEDYTKQLPSVSYQTAAPGSTVVYMRGVATGGDGNHSGSLPSVGSYLDEQPITTIGGTLDVHIYDIARIESLAGPQGTLFGASSQAGTIRIITNKPELGVTSGRLDGEINKVAHGGSGGSLEGMINLPVADNIAFRASAFYQRDAGYIDNVFGERTYLNPEGPAFEIDNSAFVENNFNVAKTYGGRAALKIDLNENWTVTPSVMHQNLKTRGVFFMDEDQGDLDTVRFQDEPSRDKFTQYALTVEGKIANFDVTYAGAYMHRPTFSSNDYTDYTDAYEAYYIGSGCDLNDDDVLDEFSLVGCQAYRDNDGNNINPRQWIDGGNNFKKMSQELRIASPSENPFRVLVGAFYQRQTNDILQRYHVDDLADDLSVPGYPGLIWLTKQERIDRDYALFGEATFDVTPQITLIAGGRYYKFDNTVIGFNGMGPDNPPNINLGYNRCLTTSGTLLQDDPLTPLIEGGVDGTPCTNVGVVEDGKLKPKRSKDNGFIHRLSAQYRPRDDLMFYGTWSKGFRPGGINRQPIAPSYSPDFLTNYELGWKTSFGRLRWNGAIYHQVWDQIQFSFLGENSLTITLNGRKARINGIESDVSYVAGGLTLNASAAFTDAKTKGNICVASVEVDPSSDCSALLDAGELPGPEDDVYDFIVTPSGTRLPVTPKFKMAATARYAWDIWTGKAHVQAGVSHQSSAGVELRQNVGSEEDPVNPNDAFGRIKSATLVDLFAGYDWDRYNMELFAINVFDERNETSRGTACGVCRIRIIPGRPRTIGLRAGVKF